MALIGIEHTHLSDPYASAITSVVRIDKTIWCGLTGGAKCLIPFNIDSKSWGEPVEVFPWVDKRPQRVSSKVHNALGALEDGRVVIGEGILYSWDGIPFQSNNDAGFEEITKRRTHYDTPPLKAEDVCPTDVSQFDMRCMTGGKVLIYNPADGAIEEVGQVAPFTYVQSMVVDSKRKMAYGHTIGNCHFFVADLEKKTVEDHGRISTFAFHNMVVAPDGVVFGAWIDFDAEEKLRIMRYDPAKGFVERLRESYLDDPGKRVQGNKGIDQWLVHSSGEIYLGISGTGNLYKFNTDALELEEIGHVGDGGRVTSLDEDEHGRILFSAGFPKMSIGRYDPSTKKLENFGPITEKYDKIYFHGSCYLDKTMYLAETDSGVASLWEVPIPE